VLIDGWPDAELFETVVGDVIARAAGGHPRVHAFGEMVALLWADGKREATIRLEELWNALADRRSFSLLCGYPIAAFGGEGDGTLFLRVCGEHSEVAPAESYPALASPDERLRVVTHLQQKAQALETEMGQRKEAEAARQKTLRELMTLYAMGRILSAELDLQRSGPSSTTRPTTRVATTSTRSRVRRRRHSSSFARRGTRRSSRPRSRGKASYASTT